jgi:hypothetical protein
VEAENTLQSSTSKHLKAVSNDVPDKSVAM